MSRQYHHKNTNHSGGVYEVATLTDPEFIRRALENPSLAEEHAEDVFTADKPDEVLALERDKSVPPSRTLN